jgi:hypothetical protein
LPTDVEGGVAASCDRGDEGLPDRREHLEAPILETPDTRMRALARTTQVIKTIRKLAETCVIQVIKILLKLAEICLIQVTKILRKFARLVLFRL